MSPEELKVWRGEKWEKLGIIWLPRHVIAECTAEEAAAMILERLDEADVEGYPPLSEMKPTAG